jgi:hypothetical protein
MEKRDSRVKRSRDYRVGDLKIVIASPGIAKKLDSCCIRIELEESLLVFVRTGRKILIQIVKNGIETERAPGCATIVV